MKNNTPCYALIPNDRSADSEPSFTLLLVHNLGKDRQHVAQKVKAVINRETHYVEHTYETQERALASTSFEVCDHAGKILKASE